MSLSLIRRKIAALLGTAGVLAARPPRQVFGTADVIGTVIVRLSDPFEGMGAGDTTFAAIGVVPPQLALVGNTIVRGGAPAIGGRDYTIRIAKSVTDGRSVVEDLTFMALGSGTATPIAAPTPTSPPAPPTPPPPPVAIVIAGTPPATGTVGIAYAFRPVVSNGAGARVFTLASGVLLAGLAFDPATGAITGTPTAAGAMNGIVVRVTDTTGSANTQATNVTIVASSVTPTPPPSFDPGAAQNQTISFAADLGKLADPAGETMIHVARPGEWSLVRTAGYDGMPPLPRLTTDRDGVVFAEGDYNGQAKYAVLHDAGVLNGVVSFDLTSEAADVTQACFAVLAKDADNLIVVMLDRIPGSATGFNGPMTLSVRARVAGIQTSLLEISTITKADDLPTIRVAIEYKPATQQLSIMLAGIRGVAVDLAAYADSLGTKFGWTGERPYAGNDGGTLVRNLRHDRSSGQIAVTTIPARVSGLSATISGTWDNARLRPTYIGYRLVNAGSSVPGAWMVDETQTVNADGTWSTRIASADPGAFKVQTRFHNDTGTISEIPADQIRFGATVDTTLFGTNLKGSNAYAGTPILTDWGVSSVVLNAYNASPASFFIPYANIVGDFTLTTNTGISLTAVEGIDTFTSILSTNPVAGQHRIRITQDMPEPFAEKRALRFTGPVTRLNVARDGVTDLIDPNFVDHALEGAVVRDLDMVGANTTPAFGTLPRNRSTDDRWIKGDFGGQYVPFDIICRAAGARHAKDPSFQYLWHIAGVDCTDDEIRQEARWARDLTPSTFKIIHQMSNEQPWNFFNNMASLARYAALKGIGKAGVVASNPGPTPPSSIDWIMGGYGVFGDIDVPGQYPLITRTAMKANDRYVYNISGVGHRVYRARRDLPVKSVVGLNENFEYDNDYFNDGDCFQAARRAIVHMHHHHLTIWKEEFGAGFTTRVFPALMAQSNDQDMLVQMETELNFMPEYTGMIKMFGAGGYANIDQRGNDSYPDPVDDIDADIRRSLPNVGRVIDRVIAACTARGWTPAFYEVGSHPNPYEGSGNYRAAYEAWNVSDKARAFVRDHVILFRQKAPNAIVVWYDGIGSHHWRLRPTWAKKDEPRYRGWIEGQAAQL